MNTLPKKIVYDIANFLDEKDIINFCETNKRLYSIGNELYFMNKYFNRFKNVVSINFLLIKSIITGCGDLYKGQEKKLSNICKFVTPRGRYIYVIDINYNLYIIDNGQSINKSIIDKFFQTNTKFQSKNIIKIAENIKDIQTNNFKSLILTKDGKLFNLKIIDKIYDEFTISMQDLIMELINQNIKEIGCADKAFYHLSLNNDLTVILENGESYKSSNVKLVINNHTKIYYVDYSNVIYSIEIVNNLIYTIYKFKMDITIINLIIDYDRLFVHLCDGDVYSIYENENQGSYMGNFIKILKYGHNILTVNNNLDLIAINSNIVFHHNTMDILYNTSYTIKPPS